jgi:uncharacterized membrane protein
MRCSIFWWREDTINKSSRLGMQLAQPHVTSPLGRYRITFEQSLGFPSNQGSTLNGPFRVTISTNVTSKSGLVLRQGGSPCRDGMSNDFRSRLSKKEPRI